MITSAFGTGLALLMAVASAGAETRRLSFFDFTAVPEPSRVHLAQAVRATGDAPKASGPSAKVVGLIRIAGEAAAERQTSSHAVEIVGTSRDVLRLGPGDVTARVVAGQGSEYLIQLALAPGPTAEFARMTELYLGQVMEVYLCGELAMSVHVVEKISSGRVSLAAGLTESSAKNIADRIERGDCAGFDPQDMED